MNLTKIELLWSRYCPLKCTGCAMSIPVSQLQHRGTVEEWDLGMKNVATKWKTKFVAIYGAEPLLRSTGLIELINSIYSYGMKATIITAIPRNKFLLELLKETPLDSVTVSYDGIFLDEHRKLKETSGLYFLERNPQIRDRAVVATIADFNIGEMPDMIRRCTDLGYWFLFDFLHKQHHAKYSKCTNSEVDSPTRSQIAEIIPILIEMKQSGKYLIHCSEEYLSFIYRAWMREPRDVWHCKNEKKIVGWLTVDSDGSILPCDDWQVKFKRGEVRVWDYYENMLEELVEWKDSTVDFCRGCAWNTHYDAIMIEDEQVDIGTYIHDK